MQEWILALLAVAGLFGIIIGIFLKNVALAPSFLEKEAETKHDKEITKFIMIVEGLVARENALLQAQDAKTYPIAFEEGKKQGMRGMVSVLSQSCKHEEHLLFCEICLQAKFKELGL